MKNKQFMRRMAKEYSSSTTSSTTVQSTSLNNERYLSEPSRSIDEFYEQASLIDTTSSAIPYWIIFVAMGFANGGDAAEITNMNFVLSNEEFAKNILQGDFRMKGAMLAACIFGGMLIGGLLTGAVGDHMGRRPTLLLGLSLNSAAGFLAAIVPGFFSLCILRFAAGLGVGAILSSLVTLATESSPPSKRGRNVAFVGCFFTFGTVYVALLALFLFGRSDVSWRVFMALCAVPSFLGMTMVYIFVPESARFLALQNQPEEATKVANQIAYSMGYRGRMLQVEEVKHHHYSNRSNFMGGSQNPNKTAINRATLRQKASKAFQNIQKLYAKDIRTKTIMLQVIWMTLSFGAGLSTWINVILKQIQVSDVYMDSLYYSLASIPGNIMAAMLMDRMGRKSLLAFGMTFACFSLLYFSRIALLGTPEAANTAVLCACSFHSFLVLGWGTVNVITSETFPTEVRSTGLGVCAASARFVAMVVQYINGSFVDRPDLLLSISSLAMLMGAIFSAALSEMSSKPLKDTILFNGMTMSEHGRKQISGNGEIEMDDKARLGFV